MKTTWRFVLPAAALVASLWPLCGLAEPAAPRLENGGFEDVARSTGRPKAWYYVRQARVVVDDSVPGGNKCLVFSNAVPGRDSQAQQSFDIDGSQIEALEVSCWVRARHVRPGQAIDQRPQLRIAFYDESLARVGLDRLGPWFGTFDWTHIEGQFPVPRECRTVVVWVGLMGGTGEAAFDRIEFEPAPLNPSVFTPGLLPDPGPK